MQEWDDVERTVGGRTTAGGEETGTAAENGQSARVIMPRASRELPSPSGNYTRIRTHGNSPLPWLHGPPATWDPRADILALGELTPLVVGIPRLPGLVLADS
jgi:hypothetical protein